jgi:hypothetical protein
MLSVERALVFNTNSKDASATLRRSRIMMTKGSE